SFPMTSGTIQRGARALAERLASHPRVALDGYGGVLWEALRAALDREFMARGLRVAWRPTSEAFRPPEILEDMLAPYLGGSDPLFGRRYDGSLRDFFDPAALARLQPDPHADLSITYGPGAALAAPGAFLAYLDLPKDEIQRRAGSGSISNLGCLTPAPPKLMYKRFYFVDWPALNAHKQNLLPQLDLIADAQDPQAPTFTEGADLRATLDTMSRNVLRARPWFAPGPWGGQWLKQSIPGLPQDVANYAWSFELIAPENGLVLHNGPHTLEVSFDTLMFHAAENILGEAASRFGHHFPIRFDYLDTMNGGNLSIQCHPAPAYIRQHFGEPFTQDETYYILDCQPGAQVYLGFQDDIDPTAFRAALEACARTGRKLDPDRWLHHEDAHKHDLFLIPHGTVHASGAGNMVLEISATPYIFTFKMYDWQRLGLDGQPRPLNLERAFANLDFERTASRIPTEFVSRPRTLAAGPDWRVLHLPTHPDHFYDVHRLEFSSSLKVETNDSCHVLNVVEGDAVRVRTAEGMEHVFHYAESFVVPAAAGSYTLSDAGGAQAGGRSLKVVKAFVKPGQGQARA
ncbi:MAG TPA: class I mannose-6-phosphate isomerase, partial [Trueperaceae bacterium]